MQLAALRDPVLSGEGACLLVYNFISKDYKDNWTPGVVAEPEPTLPDVTFTVAFTFAGLSGVSSPMKPLTYAFGPLPAELEQMTEIEWMPRFVVTISIPIYHCENHIISCLQSVVNQTYQNLEILLVDDLGNDNSMLLVEDYILKNPHFNFKILKNERNSGLSVVRNVGIDNAKGKYIFFLDSDDEITPDCISKMVEIAEHEEVEMVCGNVKTVRLETKEEISAFRLLNTKEKITGNTEIFESFIQGKFPVPSWNKLILLDFLKQNQLYFTPGLFAQTISTFSRSAISTILEIQSGVISSSESKKNIYFPWALKW
jgi:glycosyltransferase involved in cell wall biosynthesis